MSGLKLWPVVVGLLIDIGGSIGAGIVFVVAVVAFGGAVDDETLSTPQLIVTEILGLLFTATGGFVAAQMARMRHLQHGIAVGVGSLCIGLIMQVVVDGPVVPAWFEMIGYLAIVPAGAAGGYLAARAATSRAAES
jgi:putative membrane protein (TIGR04086 family)